MEFSFPRQKTGDDLVFGRTFLSVEYISRRVDGCYFRINQIQILDDRVRRIDGSGESKEGKQEGEEF